MEWDKHTPEEQEKIKKSIGNFTGIRRENQQEYGDFIKKASAPKCLHENCTECHGTGVKDNGTQCIHYLSCPCPKCSPQYL